jgi:excinuclease ABC subunit C
MEYQQAKKKKIPQAPGVYFFVGSGGKILYIGKATSLRDRVQSYFTQDVTATRGTHIAAMVEKSKSIRFTKTDSVLEALVLEADLIKKHHPPYNTKEKDDKSWNHIVITKEPFPRVRVVRGRDLMLGNVKEKIDEIFGPFPRGGILKDAMKIIRKIFPFRDYCTPGTGKPCFNAQIGLCPGVCTSEISQNEYHARIKNLKLFLRGRKKDVIRNLTNEMRAYAKAREFEKAGEVKRILFALTHIQDIALLKNADYRGLYADLRSIRIEGYDIAHMSGKHLVGVMTVVENGETMKNEYRKFKIKSFQGVDDTRALREVLERRLKHPEWQYPKLIVVDGGTAQKNAAEMVLRGAGSTIPVVSVVKDKHHRPREILGERKFVQKYEREILLANSEAHRFAVSYHRQTRGKLK